MCIITRISYDQRYQKDIEEELENEIDWKTFFGGFIRLKDYQRAQWHWMGNEATDQLGFLGLFICREY